MQNSKLHTLKSILTEGIKLDGKEDSIEISCIYIPKIQRAYAQGRNEESDIRKDFLDALFNVLESDEDKSIELSFLFGSKQIFAKKQGTGFELLDGQQRTTTLFLLYWYISMIEKKCVPDFLQKFTYDTRDTSIQFLDKITSKKFSLDIPIESPSKSIRNNKWFTEEFYCDPTVCSMLNMLDGIHERYQQKTNGQLYDRLERLQFYVLILENFDMNDELYIKMNSRGLPLVPFENFKASIVKFMKAKERKGLYGADEAIEGEQPYWLKFITNIDAIWIDLFWSYKDSSDEVCNIEKIIDINDKQIGIRYLNFFNRYLFTKSCLIDELKQSKLSSLSSFFYKEAESEKMHERLFGWEYYDEIFRKDNYFAKIEKVLNEFHSYWTDIQEELQDPYQNVNGFDILSDEIILSHRVIFAAITEFIEKLPNGAHIKDENIFCNFKRMLRVTFNIIENTTIESPEVATRVIKAISEIINAEGAIDSNFYYSLSTNKFESKNRQLEEEIEKAKAMFSGDIKTYDENWEKVFVEAEEHPFFKGSILFFFSSNNENTKKSEDFRNRYNIVKQMFDKNGITEEYRKDHILIRAIISVVNFWEGGLKGRYITERSEKEKYLKILLTNYTQVRTMFCEYFAPSPSNDLSPTEYFTQVINKSFASTNEPDGFKLLFHRLTKDEYASKIFDWIRKTEENKTKYFCLQNNRDSYLFNIPGSWYDRILLDTERHLIIPHIVQTYGMNYENKDQANLMQIMNDTWGWSIKINKQKNNHILQLDFNEWKTVHFSIYGEDVDTIAQIFNSPTENKKIDHVLVASVQYNLKEYQSKIEDKIKEIEEMLSNSK